MPKFAANDVHNVMKRPEDVRNVAILGAMGHGKSTVADILGARTGFLAEQQIGSRFAHMRADEKEKGITLRGNVVSMVLNGEGMHLPEEQQKKQYLFHLIDSPGHMEFSPEAMASIRMADGAVVVVDALDGVNVQTDNLISWALRDRVKPVLFINKIDRLIIDMQKSAGDIYQDIRNCVESANVTIATQVGETPFAPNLALSPEKGNVIIGSAINGWAFTLRDFAKIYAKKFGVDEEKMQSRLWGDNFFNEKTKKFSTSCTHTDGSMLPSTFENFVLSPIKQLIENAIEGNPKWEKMVSALGIELKKTDEKLEGKTLAKRVMQLWLNAGDCISSVVVSVLPNPKVAQAYRTDILYSGPTDDTHTNAIKACDPSASMMMHVVKMVPTGAAGRFYAVGRVFSGTVTTAKYRIQNPHYTPEDESLKGSVQESKVQSVHAIISKDFAAVPDVPAGNICAISGIDQFLLKNGTLCTDDTYNFIDMKFSVSAIVRISVKPKESKNLPKLVDGMKRLSKSDMLIQCVSEESGDHVIAGCGDEHLKLCTRDLLEHAGVEFIQGVPTVGYKETCIGRTAAFGKAENPALSKSPNKHNRLFVIAEPLAEEVSMAIEQGRVFQQQDMKARSKILCNEFSWDKTDTLKIWGFGPADIGVGGANLIVDQTKGIQYLNEIRESVNSGLLWATKEGPLCEENMRGVRFNLMDVKLHADSIHRGMGQIQPTARRVFYASLLTAMPRFQEPIFRCDIVAPVDQVAGVRQALASKRGELYSEETVGGKVTVSGYLPVAETIGEDTFSKVLQMKTSGKAFPAFSFDHWKLLQADPLKGPEIKGGKKVADASKTYEMMLAIRERKGLKVEPPLIDDYLDKL
eukprot:gnl/TRDRNA2_/TRDRNA2_177970_c0_seq2.p1 gnl/TRDRNA2_/TRDRNA2_177970_c0~~gnl/TRDRNA2_/TRDRNA2_177970_c0_seq2.p1  ORF type:complete len:861 (+),score=187.56 gnl/TRDRNA2_/TRDRNA2_177970_c0_seq2:108-2690(+)